MLKWFQSDIPNLLNSMRNTPEQFTTDLQYMKTEPYRLIEKASGNGYWLANGVGYYGLYDLAKSDNFYDREVLRPKRTFKFLDQWRFHFDHILSLADDNEEVPMAALFLTLPGEIKEADIEWAKSIINKRKHL